MQYKKKTTLLRNWMLFVFFLFINNNHFGQNKFITFTNPVNEEILNNINNYTINWHTLNIKNIKIEYSIDLGKSWILIDSNLSAIPTEYNWFISDLLLGEMELRISDVNNTSISNSVKIFLQNEPLIKNSSIYSSSEQTQANPLKIMPLGNSITRGLSGSDDDVGYRRKLFLDLFDNNFNVNFVGSKSEGIPLDFDRDHEGHSGWHAKHPTNVNLSIADNLYGWLEQSLPEIILLHIGTNDITNLQTNSENITDVVNDVESILDTIDIFQNNYSHNITVVLAKIINREDDSSTSQAEDDSTSKYNLLLQSMAENRITNGDKIFIIDQESALIYPDNLVDGLHPNQIGYDKMSDVWYNALEILLTDTLKIVKQPKAKGIILGDSVQFKVHIFSQLPVKYQWHKNGENILGANDSIYTINEPTILEDSTLYSCTISNILDTAYTDEVYLFVTDSTLRVTDGEIISYSFEEGDGDIIYDQVNKESINLLIHTPESIKWIPHGIKIDSSVAINSENAAIKVNSSIKIANQMTVEVWLKPSTINQIGPARIFTISKNSIERNFTFSQNSDKYDIRLRTTETNENGIPSISTIENTVDSNITHFAFTRSSLGENRIYVNNVLIHSNILDGDILNWDSTYQIGIANEFVEERPWVGNLYHISVYNRALSQNELLNNYLNSVEKNLHINAPINFAGFVNDSGFVELSWEDMSTNEDGFIIEGRVNKDSLFTVLDTVNSDINYYQDISPKNYTPYEYRVYAYNNVAVSSFSDIIEMNVVSVMKVAEIPNLYDLYQNYPNPFNPLTNIKYSLPYFSNVRLVIFNILGEIIIELVNDNMMAGTYSKIFDGSDLSSGIYFYKISAKSLESNAHFTSIKKLLIVK